MRVLWMAAELGLSFKHEPWEFDDPRLKEPGFLSLNPAGAIPTLVDGAVTLSESLAINLYLAKTYGAEGAEPLYPQTLQREADILRWTLWAQGHLEPWVQRELRYDTPGMALTPQSELWVQRALETLDRHLSARDWLCAPHFTVGDLNVAGVLSPSRASVCDLSGYGHVSAWLARCYARPAAGRTREQYDL